LPDLFWHPSVNSEGSRHKTGKIGISDGFSHRSESKNIFNLEKAIVMEENKK
jgi:hypothetical protein